jgi:G patch domain-containing protein 1
MAGVVTYGRGFDPLSCAPEFEKVKLDSNDEKKESEKSLEPKSLRKTRGFGTGIFDDEDDEDYDIHVPSNFNKYIGEDEEQEDAFIKKHELKIEKKSPKIITTATTNQRKGGLLEGFHLQINSTYTQPKFFVAPYPPGNWTPLPTFLSPAYISEKANQEKEEGEKMKTQSIFSYLNSKNKERLEAFISQASTTSISTSNLPKKEAQAPLPIYSVPTKVAEAALKGFMPFGNDLPKQARYKTFLEDIISKSKNEEPLQDSLKKLSNDEANETREFSKAAMIYRPLSNMISSRFSNETGLDVKSEKEELVWIFFFIFNYHSLLSKLFEPLENGSHPN